MWFPYLICALGCSSLNNRDRREDQNSDIYVVRESEMTVFHNQHRMLDNAKDIVKSSSKFTFSSSFRPASEWQHSFQVEGSQESIPILKFVKGKDYISSTYVIDNNTGHDLTISLIALQGDQNAGIRVKGIEEWSQSLEIPAANDATTQVAIEVKWSTHDNSSKELTMFSYKHDNPTPASVPGITRTMVVHQDVEITEEMLKERQFTFEKLNPGEKISFWPIPKLVDETEAAMKLRKVEHKIYSTNKANAILLSPIPYKTGLDVLWIGGKGEVKKIAEKVPIFPNQGTKITLTEEQQSFIYDYDHKQFFLFVNNREHHMLADYQLALTKKIPFMTTFSQAVEIHPYFNK